MAKENQNESYWVKQSTMNGSVMAVDPAQIQDFVKDYLSSYLSLKYPPANAPVDAKKI